MAPVFFGKAAMNCTDLSAEVLFEITDDAFLKHPLLIFYAGCRNVFKFVEMRPVFFVSSYVFVIAKLAE